MKPFLLITLLALSLGEAAHAQSATAPATQPAAPAVTSALPPGHPALGTPSTAPAGLPPGHPDLASLGTKAPTLQATVLVAATQKTAGGPALSGDDVTLDLYAPSQATQHFQAKLDAEGKANFPNLSYRGMSQPLVYVKHAGVDYRAVGGTMDSQHPGQKIEVNVFETAPQAPATSIQMRHIFIERTPAGLQVTEMFEIQIAGDRSWVGDAQPDSSHVTLDFALASDAANLQLPPDLQAAGFQFASAHLRDTSPLIPGNVRMQFTYTLPVKDGKADFDIAMPIAVGHMMLFAPNDGSTLTAPGLEDKGVVKGNMRCFFGMALPAGKNIPIGLTHLAPPQAPTTQTRADLPPGEPPMPQPLAVPPGPRWPIIAGSVSAVVVVGGILVIFLRPTQHAVKKG